MAFGNVLQKRVPNAWEEVPGLEMGTADLRGVRGELEETCHGQRCLGERPLRRLGIHLWHYFSRILYIPGCGNLEGLHCDVRALGDDFCRAKGGLPPPCGIPALPFKYYVLPFTLHIHNLYCPSFSII